MINHPDGDGSVTTGAFADSVVNGSNVDNVMTLGDDTVPGVGGATTGSLGGAGNDVIDGSLGRRGRSGAALVTTSSTAAPATARSGAALVTTSSTAAPETTRLYWGSAAPEGIDAGHQPWRRR